MVRAFTQVELLVVIFVVFVLFAVAFSWLARMGPRSSRISCVNNLKNIGLAYRTFAVDNEGKFPWQLPAHEGGTAEVVDDPVQVWRHFAAISNELSTPKILLCPHDTHRQRNNTWTNLVSRVRNNGVSYFIGLDGSEERPASILGGDRNLTTNGIAVSSARLVLTTDTPVGFTRAMHQSAGWILLGDGGVEPVTSSRLNELVRDALKNAPSPSLRLLVP